MKYIAIIILCFVTLFVCGQTVNRVEVSGKIVVDSEDKEGVTVYNTSSNKGTTTDEKGDFVIKVALNDIIEFGALQFKDFSITIDEKILESKQVTVILVEEVNKLDEVLILPYPLTGNLNADMESVKTHNVDMDAIYLGIANINEFEFEPDHKTKADNLAFNEYNPRMEYLLDVGNILGYVIKKIIAPEDKKSKTKKEVELKITPISKTLDTYNASYLNANFNIPIEKAEIFKDYIKQQGVDAKLLQSNKEVLLLERITELSKSFLKKESEKN